MTRLYSNENFPQPAVDALRAFGHDVLTTSDSGKAGLRISDEEVLAFATAEARILVTYNRKHFIRLHNDNSNHAGIILIPTQKHWPNAFIRNWKQILI